MRDMFESNSSSLIDDMQREIDRMDAIIKKGGLPSAISDIIKQNRKDLQDSLNKFLSKKNVLTQGDYDKAYDILRTSKKVEMQESMVKSLITFGLVLAGAGLLYYILKPKKAKE